MGRSRTLARERKELEREHGEERLDSTVKEGRFQGGQGGQATKASSEEVEGSMSMSMSEWTQKLFRTICIVLASLLVWPNLRWEKRLQDEEPAHKIKNLNGSE